MPLGIKHCNTGIREETLHFRICTTSHLFLLIIVISYRLCHIRWLFGDVGIGKNQMPSTARNNPYYLRIEYPGENRDFPNFHSFIRRLSLVD